MINAQIDGNKGWMINLHCNIHMAKLRHEEGDILTILPYESRNSAMSSTKTPVRTRRALEIGALCCLDELAMLEECAFVVGFTS